MSLFHNSNESPSCFKVKVLLNELGIEYRQEDYQLDQLENSDFSEKFPNAQVPAFEDEDVSICDSAAIAQYLAEKHDKLIPRDLKSKAIIYQLIHIESSLQLPVVGGQGIFGELFKPESERNMDRVQALLPEAQRIANVLGMLLGEKEYFAGEFSIADILFYAAVTKAIQYDVYKNPPQNLVDWDIRMGMRESVIAARKLYKSYA